MKIVSRSWNMGLVDAVRATWPDAQWPHWHKYDDENSVKYATKDAGRLTAPAKLLIETMARIQLPNGWFPDLDLHGAGMHWIPAGGHLGRHLDGQRHPLTGWRRRANIILFLDSCEGGELCIDGCDPIIPQPGLLLSFTADKYHEVRKVMSGDRRTLSLFAWDVSGDESGLSERADFGHGVTVGR